MEESFTGCAGSAETDRDRTPPTAWARSQFLAQRPAGAEQPWPAGAVVEPPPGLWQRIERRLREENIIRR